MSDRDTSVPTDSIEPTLRARASPTLTRSFDPNDPDARERQRTMDVDMALHLSRARRETVVHPTSPFNGPLSSPEPPFGSFSVVEQHDLQLARGEEPHALDHVVIPDSHDTVPGSAVAQDPSLLAAIQGQFSLPNLQGPTSSRHGLPRYQVSLPLSVFDFAPLESFAVEEKESLGLTSSGPPTIRLRHQKERRDDTQSTSSTLPGSGVFDISGGTTAVPRRPGARQRKLSESAPLPRPHRKHGRGKLVLFENQANESVSALPGRLVGTGQLSVVPSSEDVAGMFYQYRSPPPTGISGVASPGHDRPYRFSFYSSALSATIHARSLCELPAEGQSFEDLFTGVSSPSLAAPKQGNATGGLPAFAAPVPLPPRPNVSIIAPNGQRTTSSFEGMPTSGIFGRPAEKAPPSRPNGSGPSTTADAEANTWWLDIQSPTDEEMKVLSKVINAHFCAACVYSRGVLKVFSIHPLTTEDIQMEEAREKIELFRNYYLVCFRSFDQDPYSPTYLEPVNMYIIVFREGILSVRPFFSWYTYLR